MKIVISNDHAACDLKRVVKEYVEGLGHTVIDVGNQDGSSCNYPEQAKAAADLVVSGECELGILICGTGVGISIAANKVNGIRCGCCSDTATARLIRQHNDANMIAFGARIVGNELAKDIVSAFLTAEFEGGRHQKRVDMITDIENSQK